MKPNPRKVSQAQKAMLHSIATTGDSRAHLTTRTFKSCGVVFMALVRNGLVQGGKLTEAGRRAL